MPDDVRDIREHYSTARWIEHEEQRLNRAQLEFDMTLKYLDEFLPPSAQLLEIGAATGRYTVAMAGRGHRGVAVDLSAAMLARCDARLRAANVTNWQTGVADARDLSSVEGTFDAVLIMGPMYHLLERDDRKCALSNAWAKLREGGLIVTAWISRLSVVGDLLKNVPTWAHDEYEVQSVLRDGRNDPPGRYPEFRAYFARTEEVGPIHEEVGFTTLTLAGIEPGIASYDDAYNRLTPPLRGKWLDLLYRVSREPTTIVASRHLLYIGQKTSGL